MKVFLYLRVSSEEQAKHGYSLEAQEEALKDFCQRNNHVILGIYRDEGISGRKPYTKRPAMVQLLSDVETIKPDIILFTKLDRWFRNIKEYYKVQDILDRCKVDWKAINEEYDTSTASGRLYVNIKLSIAQDEADRTSERIKDIQSQLIAQGKVLGGSVPIGYAIKDKRLVFGDDIQITKDAIEHYMLHQSAHATTRYLNGLYGRSFTHTHIIRLLRSTVLKGEYRGNTAYCEPLISPEKWDELQNIIDNNIKHASRRNTYLFTGLIECPVCGHRMAGCHDEGRKYYRCPNHYYGTCEMAHIVNEKKVEKWLLENIEENFNVNVTMKPKEKREDPKKYRDRLNRLNEIYLLGNITQEEYKAKSAELQQKIAEIQKKPALKTQIFASNWKDLYMELDEEHRRIFWRKLIKKIVVTHESQCVDVIY